jgi:hypothetical protein
MTHQEIENRVLEALERFSAGRKLEDARVEFKADWGSDPSKAARQLAGHANAARSDWVLWIIGVNERQSRIVGASDQELANWWPQIQSCFEDKPPVLTNLAVGDVHALWFATPDSPYVYRDKTKGGVLEVPWREGNATRSARHADLVRLLYPRSQRPEVHVIGGRLICRHGDSRHIKLTLQAIVVPVVSVTLIQSQSRSRFFLGGTWIEGGMPMAKGNQAGGCSQVDGGLVLTGPGALSLEPTAQLVADVTMAQSEVEVHCCIRCAPGNEDVIVRVRGSNPRDLNTGINWQQVEAVL